MHTKDKNSTEKRQPTHNIRNTDSFACVQCSSFIHSFVHTIPIFSFFSVFSNLTTIGKMVCVLDLDKSICYLELKINQYAKWADTKCDRKNERKKQKERRKQICCVHYTVANVAIEKSFSVLLLLVLLPVIVILLLPLHTEMDHLCVDSNIFDVASAEYQIKEKKREGKNPTTTATATSVRKSSTSI